MFNTSFEELIFIPTMTNMVSLKPKLLNPCLVHDYALVDGGE
jgi:hypothetical protein